MKIAIPLFKDRISPHFGSSLRIFLVDIENAAVHQETTLEMCGKSPIEIAGLLLDLGVEKIICGGIQSFYKEWLISKGVAVVDNQRGLAREVIREILEKEGLFKNGTLKSKGDPS